MNIKKCPDKSMVEYGECIYPYYGLAPHTHTIKNGKIIIDGTKILDKNNYPDNFREDPEAPGCGGYHCPYNEVCKK